MKLKLEMQRHRNKGKTHNVTYAAPKFVDVFKTKYTKNVLISFIVMKDMPQARGNKVEEKLPQLAKGGGHAAGAGMCLAPRLQDS